MSPECGLCHKRDRTYVLTGTTPLGAAMQWLWCSRCDGRPAGGPVPRWLTLAVGA